MPLICLCTVELARPGVSRDLVARWRRQRDRHDALYPEPNGDIRRWVGDPDGRDWDRLVAFKERDGWRLVCHRRDFIDHKEEKQDGVNLA